MMPGIDGFEVCKRLKQDDKTQMIPVVMVTALRRKEDRIRALEAGADDFLSKPVDRTELLVRVKSLLRIKSYHDQLLNSYKEIALKNEKLKELEGVREGLTHMIIHDLNNPLAVILGNLELIKAENQNLSENERDRIEKCLIYILGLKQLIQSLLDVHRMEEGKLQPVKAVINIPELINGVFGQFTPKAEVEEISLTFCKPGGIPNVRADQGLIGRVIANLLSNAIRYTPAWGEIVAATDYLPKSKSIRVSIKDNGNGLEPEYHERIFDKFEQVKLKDSAVTVGSVGLGLAFCKMAVEAHGGEIWVESEGNGKGCTFCFTMPI
jgi:signal transduction histidine kinase